MEIVNKLTGWLRGRRETPNAGSVAAPSRGRHRPAWPGQPRWPELAAEYGDLVAQHQELGDYRGLASGELWQPAGHR